MKRQMGRKAASAVSIIGGADGPTSVWLCSKNQKQPLKHRIRNCTYKAMYNIRKNWYEKHITADSHTMDEVCQYIQNELSFTEVSSDAREYQQRYEELRAAFIMQYASELLGTYQEPPKLQSHSEEDVKKFIAAVEERNAVAQAVSKDVFDIEYHCFRKQIDDTQYEISIEKHFGYIGGGCICGGADRERKKLAKQYSDEFKKVYQYYGVTQEDIDNQSKRYEQLLRTLATR